MSFFGLLLITFCRYIGGFAPISPLF